jgi:hypothetical protein
MNKFSAVVVVLPLVFASLACPTRPGPSDGDGGLGGSAGATGEQTGGAGGSRLTGTGGAGGSATGAGGSSTGGSTTATGGSGGTAGASGSGGSGSGLGGSGGSGGSGGGAAGCSGGLTSCNGSCANLQSDPNNCGTCGTSCGSLGCSSGQCGCTASTPNGTICIRPGQTPGTCWAGACVLPAYFPGCNSAADCVPGGCTGPGGYCLGTVDVQGQVSCSATEGAYVACPASQGCSAGPYAGEVQCGSGTSTGTADVTCDGPSDCPANNDCCYIPGSTKRVLHCLVQPQPGAIGSGCAAYDTNPNGPQAGVACDPLNPSTSCPAGQSCVSNFGGAQVSFACQ